MTNPHPKSLRDGLASLSLRLRGGKGLGVRAVVIIFLLLSTYPASAAPACTSNVRYPRQALSVCAETIITYPLAQGIASISAIAFGPDGALYYARPATSEIARVVPDKDGFIPSAIPYDQAQTFAANL